MSRPLTGIRVLELAGMGPGPHAALQFADMGADVVRVERPSPSGRRPALPPGRRSVAIDLKSDGGRTEFLDLVEAADILVEGFRPGVTERLGIGPDACLARNPGLVYGRVTGWGQDGPKAPTAGHDLTYLAITGVLHAIGPPEGPPVPPLNLIGDYGGGSMLLVVGVLGALLERERSGLGQVVDAAMVDGVSMLARQAWAMRGSGSWTDRRGSNVLDGGAPYYACYTCADGRYLAVAAIEPQFYSLLLEGLGLDPEGLPPQDDRSCWDELRRVFADRIAERTRDEWTEVFDGTDACVAPVLNWEEAVCAPHARTRDAFVERGGTPLPRPAPRLSRTPLQMHPPPPESLEDVPAVIASWRSSP